MVFLSIVIPAYNETKRLPATLKRLSRYLTQQKYSFEVIIVDDGSTDRTYEKTQKIIALWPNFKIIRHDLNQGKGLTVKEGMLVSSGRWRLFMDADNSTDISEIEKLFVFSKDYEVIIGSRYLRKDSIKIKQPFYRQTFSRFGNLALKNLFGLNLRDTQCGFKLYSGSVAKKVFPKLTTKKWVFDAETLVVASYLGYRIKEVPIDWYDSKVSCMQKIPLWESLRDVFRIEANLRHHVYDG